MRPIAICIAIALAACAEQPGPRPSSAPKDAPGPQKIEDLVGKPAPPFSLPSARDESTKIGVPTKDVTVVTFFGTWSMGWQEALPALEELRKKHRGVRVVAVSMDEENPKAVAERYASLPIAWSGGMATKANVDWLSGPYGSENKVFVLDRKGAIRFAHRGGKEFSVFMTPTGTQQVEDEIKTLLAEP